MSSPRPEVVLLGGVDAVLTKRRTSPARDDWDARAVGPYNMIGDPIPEGSETAIARWPGLDWSDPYRPDPPGHKVEEWEVRYDEAHRLLEERGVKVGCGDPAVDAMVERAKREGRW